MKTILILLTMLLLAGCEDDIGIKAKEKKDLHIYTVKTILKPQMRDVPERRNEIQKQINELTKTYGSIVMAYAMRDIEGEWNDERKILTLRALENISDSLNKIAVLLEKR